jgi:hypothetical protein
MPAAMCTVSWLREPGTFRLFFNRDERRSRKPALPPEIRRKGGTRFLAPRDGDFGGSWLGVNEHGVCLGLLNGYLADDDRKTEPAGGWVSRGLLLTDLLDLPAVTALRARLERRDLASFRSFLLAGFQLDGGSLLASWNGGALRFQSPIDHLNPLVSSSFATEQVRQSRIRLFHQMARRAESRSERLHLEYHASHHPSSGPYSPCMHRPDAETVSFSRIEVVPGRVRFHYVPHSPCRGLPRAGAVTLD